LLRPSVAGLAELLAVPARLLADALVPSIVACSLCGANGGADDGGVRKGGIDVPERPDGPN
jgi:hypothetical protein